MDYLTRENLSTGLGFASIVAWLFAQMPQLLKNYRDSSVEGLALPFLVSWLAGDAMNLVGCLLTHQLPFQTYLAFYFVLVDVGLCSQFVYYSSSASAIPPLSATYPHVHTPRPSYLRSHSETWHISSSHRRSSRKRRSKSGTHSDRAKSTSIGGDDPMERSWMSESSAAQSPASSRPQTVAPRSHRPSHRAYSAGTDSLSPSSASTSTLPERGRTLTRPPPPRHPAFFSTMETISGSPASGSPGPTLGHVQGVGVEQAVQEWGIAHGVHQNTRSTSRSRPPPAARRSSSMVFLSVGLLVGFGKWSAGSMGTTEVGKAWSVSKMEVVESRSDWGAAWGQARHPTFFGPAFAPLAEPTLLSRRQHGKRQVFPLSVSIANSSLPSIATSLSDEDDPMPPKHEPDDDEEEPYPYPKRDLERFVGRASAWMCTTLYLTSRLPQIWQNFRRRSVEGLSMLLFVMAFVGNSLYVLSIVTNPLLQTPGYLLESTPYLLGSGGTLCFDITIVLQSFLYSPKRMERLERDRRRMGKYGFDSEEAAALLHAEEDETDEDTAGRRSRSASLGGGRSRSSRRPISRKRSDSTELENTRRKWSSAGATPYAREESSPIFATQDELDALSHRDFDFGGARHGGDGHEVVEVERSRSSDVSRSRTRPASIIEAIAEEGESGVTIRG